MSALGKSPRTLGSKSSIKNSRLSKLGSKKESEASKFIGNLSENRKTIDGESFK